MFIIELEHTLIIIAVYITSIGFYNNPFSSETVKDFLEEYFTHSKNTLVGGRGIESLCLLCIQCFEVKII